MLPRGSSQGQPVINRATDPRLIQFFEFYDVKEDSFHLHASLIETHFCEDALRSKFLKNNNCFRSNRLRLDSVH